MKTVEILISIMLLFFVSGCTNTNKDDVYVSYSSLVEQVKIPEQQVVKIENEKPPQQSNEPTAEEIEQWLAEQRRIDEQAEKLWRNKMKEQASETAYLSRKIPYSTIKEPQSLQDRRKDAIINLIKGGIFDRIEMPGDIPRLWVRNEFISLDYQTKKSFVELVYAYYFDRPDRSKSQIYGDSVRIIDNFSGRDIGSYNLISGLNLR